MGLAWNWVAVPALVSLVLGYAMAALVVVARPDRPQNRRLAFSLVVGSTIVGGAIAIQAMGGVLLSLSIAIPATLHVGRREKARQILVSLRPPAGTRAARHAMARSLASTGSPQSRAMGVANQLRSQ